MQRPLDLMSKAIRSQEAKWALIIHLTTWAQERKHIYFYIPFAVFKTSSSPLALSNGVASVSENIIWQIVCKSRC